ncbi:hypothetical protein [Flavobacterium inviolabile]|uniref:hypothetical protein n=1 Tax=Flavobacterium inviolabile TaxID=2748320 RepID=UPI0015B0F912|nr:hypothetical protein [Flavobacterium inviolabile]
MKKSLFFLGLFLALVFTGSCDKDSDGSGATSSTPITKEEFRTDAKIDKMVDDVATVVENGYILPQNGSGKMTNTAQMLPGCVVTTSAIIDNTWNVSIDFGTEGCSFMGATLKGKIIISFTNDFETMSHTITYTFENFYYNDIAITGNRTMTRTHANANGNPETSMSLDMTITYPNGDVYHRTGTRTKEWSEGHDTPGISDDVFLITGSWSTTFPNGNVNSTTITTPLKIKRDCAYIVAGVITIIRNANTATIDYGDGTCDNQATMTINGETSIITLDGF